MDDKTLQSAIDEFIQTRINDKNFKTHQPLLTAYADFEKAMKDLETVLTPEWKELFINLQNAYGLVDGETMYFYYQEGFSDAISFILGWRDGTWK